MKQEYEQLIQLTEQVVDQAKQARQSLLEQARRDAERVRTTLEQFLPRVEQVIRQTRRRVLEGESVPADEKLVSFFEHETAIIRKGKWGTQSSLAGCCGWAKSRGDRHAVCGAGG